MPAKTISSTPAPASAMVPHSTTTRPKRSIRPVPAKRPAVIASTKTAKPATPTAWETSWPSTSATASQSLAVPSVMARASTITPIRSVRGSARRARPRCGAPRALSRRAGTTGTCATPARCASRTTATRWASGRHGQLDQQHAEQGADDRAAAEAGVEARHDRAPQAALDLGALDVHRHVPDADAEAVDEEPGDRQRQHVPRPSAAASIPRVAAPAPIRTIRTVPTR